VLQISKRPLPPPLPVGPTPPPVQQYSLTASQSALPQRI
jgi:hypothetical protein